MKTVFIVRGLPDTGKSAIALRLVECEDHVLEAAKFMRQETGDHSFRHDLVATSHIRCEVEFMKLIEQGVERIAIANTSTRNSEYQFYVDKAEEHGYHVVKLILERNPFNPYPNKRVGRTQIETMRKRFEIQL